MNADHWHHGVYLVVIAVYGFRLFAFIVNVLMRQKRGNPLFGVLAMWMISPIALIVVGWQIEHRDPSELVSVAKQAWSLLIGDVVPLPLAVLMLIIGWRKLNDVKAWYYRYEWTYSSLVFGAMIGALFHRLNAAGYPPAARVSPTMELHDFVSVSVIVAILSFGIVPVAVHRHTRRYAIYAGCFILLWVALVIGDNTLRHLVLSNMHIGFDWKTMQSVS